MLGLDPESEARYEQTKVFVEVAKNYASCFDFLITRIDNAVRVEFLFTVPFELRQRMFDSIIEEQVRVKEDRFKVTQENEVIKTKIKKSKNKES